MLCQCAQARSDFQQIAGISAGGNYSNTSQHLLIVQEMLSEPFPRSMARNNVCFLRHRSGRLGDAIMGKPYGKPYCADHAGCAGPAGCGQVQGCAMVYRCPNYWKPQGDVDDLSKTLVLDYR